MTISSLTKHKSKIALASIILASSSLTSRFLGLLRDRLLATNFGASDVLDAYQIAFILPDMVYNLFIVGAISASFIPIFSYYIHHKKKATEIANSVFNFFALAVTVALIVIYFLTPYIISWFEPLSQTLGQGYPKESYPLLVNLTRIMLLSPLLMGFSAVLTSVLHSYRHFLLPAISPLVYNLSIIAGIVWLVPRFGIYGVAVGVVFGAGLHFIVQLPAVFSNGLRFKPVLKFSKAVKDIIWLGLPRAVSLVATQASFWVNKIIALTIGSGAVSVYYFANNLQYLTVGLFGVSISLAAFPDLSSGSRVKFIKTFSRSFRQILFFTVPAAVLFLLLRAQIVRLVLGSGRFDWEDTILTANTLGFFAISIFTQSLVILLSRSFYALKDTRTPLIINVISLIVNVVLSVHLMKILGVEGLALAFSLSSFLNFFALLILLHQKTGGLDDRRLVASSLKTILAGSAMGVAVYLTLNLLSWAVDMQRVWGIFVQATGSFLVGTLIFWLASVGIKHDEAREVKMQLKKVILKLSKPFVNGRKKS